MQNLRNKILTRTMIYALMASMILTAALAIPAAARNKYPSRGRYKRPTRTERILQVSTSGTGTGTHLGESHSPRKSR
jgi:hypothetical protein